MNGAYWVFSGVLILWALSFLYFRSYIKRRTASGRILTAFRDEVDQLVAEINAATDRDLSLIEDRVTSLRGLLDDADKRIKLQHTELERHNAQADAYAALGRRYVVKNGPVPAPESPAPEQPDETGPVPGAPSQTRRPRFIRSSIQIEPKEAPFAERVMDLYRGGFSPGLIAGKLGSTIAEVDLVIALRPRGFERGPADTGPQESPTSGNGFPG
ncbi:MAG: hypothetical protein LBK40_07425 [Spirochaetaceae bacterium]|jgi:hypothetical protein|nr:hypothetical protein [Spirochaetaceae bacterium]